MFFVSIACQFGQPELVVSACVTMTEATEPPIPEEYLTEIGRISVRWSYLESIVDLCLIKLAGNELEDPRSLIPFNHMTVPHKFDTLGAYMDHLEPNYPGLRGYKSVMSDLKAAQAARNRIVHAKMGVNPRTRNVELSRLTARGRLKVNIETVKLSELQKIALQIEAASNALYMLVVKAGQSERQTGDASVNR